jgi:hypothetical protein
VAGDTVAARATGAELYDLARRLDTSKLYSVLDAMAYLACVDARYEAAARIVGFADIAHQAHGQARRRPTEQRMRASVAAILDERMDPSWRVRAADSRQEFDEVGACALALGLRDL